MALFRKTSSPAEGVTTAPENPQLFLAAFGKHPGWDDHIDDIGLETQALVDVKQALYINGIPQQFSEWDKLDELGRLPEFKHLFVWRRPTGWFVGRIWSSSDGKGRSRYPMIICAQFNGLDGVDAARRLFPLLKELEEGCKKASTADAVRRICGVHKESMRGLLSLGQPSVPPMSDSDLMERMQGGPYDEQLLRVIYQVQTQMGAYARGGATRKPGEELPRPQQIRVPAAPDHVLDSALFWLRFFVAYSDAAVPILITAPTDESWLDVTLGEPGEHEFFSLRATPKSLPPASDVPYNLDDAFRTNARTVLENFKNGVAANASIAFTGGDGDESMTRRWLKSKWFGG
jgi:hypothetical protein